MGYRGKVDEQAEARALRAENRTLAEIAKLLGVSKASVSVWTRGIDVKISRSRSASRRPHPQHLAKLAQIDELNRRGKQRLGVLSDDAFLVAGIALYAGEGSKQQNCVAFANTDPAMIRFFCAWLRRFFGIDEARLRVRVYLHEGLDLDRAEEFWSVVCDVPRAQFRAPYRARADATMRDPRAGQGTAILNRHSGVAQSAERRTVNP